MPVTMAAGLPTKLATHSSNSVWMLVVPEKTNLEAEFPTQGDTAATYTKSCLPPSTRELQVLAENFFKDSMTRGVQYSSDAAKPR